MEPLPSSSPTFPCSLATSRRSLRQAVTAALLGIALTVQMAVLVHGWETERAEIQFQRSANYWLKLLWVELDRATRIPGYVGGLFRTSRIVTDEEFKLFADELLRGRPEIDAIAWLPRQPDAGQAVHVARLLRDGAVDVVPQRDRLDMPSPDPLAQAAARALASMEPAVSARTLVHGELGPEPAFSVLAAVRIQPGPAEARGLVSIDYRIAELIEPLLRQHDDYALDAYLFDVSDANSPTLLYASNLALWPQAMLDSELHPADIAGGASVFSREFDFGGRRWLVQLRPMTPITASLWGRTALTVLAGITLTALLVSLILRRGLTVLPPRAPALASDAPERDSGADSGQGRHLLDLVPDMLIRMSAEGRLLYVSASCRQLLGWEPEQMIGRSAYDFFHPDDIYRTRYAHDQALKDPGASIASYRIRRADGSYVWLESHILVVPNPDEDGGAEIVCVCRDLAGRQAEVDALRESETMYRSAFENAPTPMLLADARSGQLLRANTAMCQFLGYSKSELRELNSRDITHPADWALTVDSGKAARTGIPSVMHKRFLRKDGSALHARVVMTLQRDQDGRARYFISHIQPSEAPAEQALEES